MRDGLYVDPQDSVGHVVLLSILVLMEALMDSLKAYRHTDFTIVNVLQPGSGWGTGRFGRRLFGESGWCCGALQMVVLDEPSHVVFISSLKQVQLKNLDQCTDEICLADQIDDTTYRTKHVADGC